MPTDKPFVTIIMPVRNEAQHIRKSLSSTFEQDYPPDSLEIIVADGMSEDGTRDIIKSLQENHANLKLIDNHQKIVPTGLNTAIKLAQGELIIRMDAHCNYPENYVMKLVALINETGAEEVGGVLMATGNRNYAQASICAASYSQLGPGGAMRSYGVEQFRREVDAVHGGCWRRDTLISIGLFNEKLARNQDDELSFRIRRAGGRIIQDSSIKVMYYVRDSFTKLFKQYIQFGYWKVVVIQSYPNQASLRHFIPAIFVLAIIGLSILSLVTEYARFTLGLMLCFYSITIITFSLKEALKTSLGLCPGITLALVSMQIGYGLGFLAGMVFKLLGFNAPDSYFGSITR